MRVFASYNNDSVMRSQASSGGVFGMLAKDIILKNGVVYGAAFDENWEVKHIRVNSVNELPRLYGSKYVFSNLNTAIADVVYDLQAGRQVLFSGTPCQAAAMRKRVPLHPNLLIVEVICHGAPDKKYWTQYLSELCALRKRNIEDIASINFRDKCTGWKKYSMSIVFSDGTEFTSFHGENSYLKAFLNNLTLRDGCFKCPFKYPSGSCADITLGDFWKLETIAPELANDEGTSLVIVRTNKGYGVLNAINQIREFTYDEIVKCNTSLTTPAIRPVKYFKFKQEASSSKNLIDLFEKWTAPSLTIQFKIKLKKFFDSVRKYTCV